MKGWIHPRHGHNSTADVGRAYCWQFLKSPRLLGAVEPREENTVTPWIKTEAREHRGSAFHQETIAMLSPQLCYNIFCMTVQCESTPRTQVRCKVIVDHEQKRDRAATGVTTGLMGTLDPTFVTTIYRTETLGINE
jgi:hypothetical protein